ncbi:hypothetical protein R8Z57_12090 [Microbacterium sp. M3]|uniref:Uncharacterized protein n=1 Tax=Microbacterium arthrosphaerae TaxID=792652 RepID=A0ABU4H6K2_9MICO|nr:MULTISPECIES: hypothetical protein [Microbacterium]MDW4573514.1 hypothetical protein [Microbacterium arthrosphaerae]MDW7607369.1 hypothetical protein [Microbacterium sp. M3]
MDEIPTNATLYEYRGETFLRHSGGGTYKRVWVDGPLTHERFPDALEFSSDPGEPWVMLPTVAFDAGFRRTVFANWHGEPVVVESVIRIGLRRGLVRIAYVGNHPDQAVAAGLSGDQFNGWSAEVLPSELEEIHVEMSEFAIEK